MKAVVLLAFAIVTADGTVTRLVPFMPRALPAGQYAVEVPSYVVALPGVTYDGQRFLSHGWPIQDPRAPLPALELPADGL